QLALQRGLFLFGLPFEKLFSLFDGSFIVAAVRQNAKFQAADLRNEIFNVIDGFLRQRATAFAAGVVLINELFNSRSRDVRVLLVNQRKQLIGLATADLIQRSHVGHGPLRLNLLQELFPSFVFDGGLVFAAGRQNDLDSFPFSPDGPNRNVVQVGGVDAPLQSGSELILGAPLVAFLQSLRLVDLVDQDGAADQVDAEFE